MKLPEDLEARVKRLEEKAEMEVAEYRKRRAAQRPRVPVGQLEAFDQETEETVARALAKPRSRAEKEARERAEEERNRALVDLALERLALPVGWRKPNDSGEAEILYSELVARPHERHRGVVEGRLTDAKLDVHGLRYDVVLSQGLTGRLEQALSLPYYPREIPPFAEKGVVYVGGRQAPARLVFRGVRKEDLQALGVEPMETGLRYRATSPNAVISVGNVSVGRQPTQVPPEAEWEAQRLVRLGALQVYNEEVARREAAARKPTPEEVLDREVAELLQGDAPEGGAS